MRNTDLARYDPVWKQAKPYMRARKNDIHIPLSFAWCQKLLDIYPDADRDICALAILLHDIGWYTIDIGEILEKGFRSDDMMTSDVRYLHEREGVRLAKPILEATGFAHLIDPVCEIIDGHDTRLQPHHLNDKIVRDADKLWRFETAGIGIITDWMQQTPKDFCDQLEANRLDGLETEAGRKMAQAELARSRVLLQLHVL